MGAEGGEEIGKEEGPLSCRHGVFTCSYREVEVGLLSRGL